MSLTVTIAALYSHHACHMDQRISDITVRLGRVPADNEAIPVEMWWTLPSTSGKDMVWSLRAAEPAVEAHAAAICVALVAARAAVALIPADKRDISMAAVEAAEAWCAEPTAERLEAVDAAYVAVSEMPNDGWFYPAVFAAARAAYTVVATPMLAAYAASSCVDAAYIVVAAVEAHAIGRARIEAAVRGTLLTFSFREKVQCQL